MKIFKNILAALILIQSASAFALKVEVKEADKNSTVFVNGSDQVPIKYLSDLNGCYSATFNSEEKKLLLKFLDIASIEELQKSLQDQIVVALTPEEGKLPAKEFGLSYDSDDKHAGVKEFVETKVKSCWEAADKAREN